MSFMQNQVLGYESPLYERRTGQFMIEPLTYGVDELAFLEKYVIFLNHCYAKISALLQIICYLFKEIRRP